MHDNNISEMFECRTANYKPPPLDYLVWQRSGLPPFRISAVEMMRRDSQIKLGMSIKTAPLLKPKIELKGDPDIVEFVTETIKSLWVSAIPKMLSALWYTRAAGEVIYKRSNGKIKFHRYKPVYPVDTKILTQSGLKYGIKVKVGRDSPGNPDGEVMLHGPKSFLYVHRREFGSWNGISEFEGAYKPWIEKTDEQGGEASRKLWYFKNAFNSGTIFHPTGDYTWTDSNGDQQKIPYRDIAREAIEKSSTGSTYTFPSEFDDRGNPLWRMEKAEVNGSGADMLEYIKHLDTEILHGLEIPDDVISQVSGTGSFAGRTIPLMAFFTSQTITLQSLFNEVKEQIIDPLVMINFGRLDYEVEKVSVNSDELMPEPPAKENEKTDPEKTQPAVGQMVNPQGDGQPEPSLQTRMSVVERLLKDSQDVQPRATVTIAL